jgi:hypothetical protein
MMPSEGAGRHGAGARPCCERAEAAVKAATTSSSCPTAGRAGPHPDPGAAGDGRRAPSPDPQGPAHLGRPRRRIRRAARSASLLPASPAMAPKRSTPISPSRRCSTCTGGEFPKEVDAYEVVSRYIKSVGKGMLKVMSKMGISTYQSYCGAQIFDAVGLQVRIRRRSISSAPRRLIEGVGLDEIAEETVRRHRDAFGDDPIYATRSISAANMPTACAARPCLDAGCGRHCCSMPCAATPRTYKEFAEMVNEQSALR